MYTCMSCNMLDHGTPVRNIIGQILSFNNVQHYYYSNYNNNNNNNSYYYYYNIIIIMKRISTDSEEKYCTKISVMAVHYRT